MFVNHILLFYVSHVPYMWQRLKSSYRMESTRIQDWTGVLHRYWRECSGTDDSLQVLRKNQAQISFSCNFSHNLFVSLINYNSIVPHSTMGNFTSKLTSLATLSIQDSAPQSKIQHGSSTTGLEDPPQGEWIAVHHPDVSVHEILEDSIVGPLT